MTENGRATMPNVFPILIYRDVPAAIEWLLSGFGFEKRLVVTRPDGTIGHVELGLGAGAIMLGAANGEPGAGGPPDGGTVYVTIDDVDAHCKRARAAGADILKEPYDTDYNSREYTVGDPEGRVWTFGTYLPGVDV
ncbi:MAG: VOC family protein [Thermomicrobiales bacterium]